jgi:XTP/dITP diphosphohydrolase
MRFVFATRSPDKIREVRQILADRHGIEFVSLAELGIPEDPREDAIEVHDTFHQNAIAKAEFFARQTGLPAIAEDSGLSVDALGGAPGVRSKRFSGRRDLRGRDLDEANNRTLLERLGDLPPERRTAHYTCAAAAVLPGRNPLVTFGTCSGRILDAPRGTGGFGYDPLFFLPELGATFAEVPPHEKHRRSHRARAFRALAALLPFFVRGLDSGRVLY